MKEQTVYDRFSEKSMQYFTVYKNDEDIGCHRRSGIPYSHPH
jgi:hypothetical protein